MRYHYEWVKKWASGNLEKIFAYICEDEWQCCTHVYSPLSMEFYLQAWPLRHRQVSCRTGLSISCVYFLDCAIVRVFVWEFEWIPTHNTHAENNRFELNLSPKELKRLPWRLTSFQAENGARFHQDWKQMKGYIFYKCSYHLTAKNGSINMLLHAHSQKP